MSIILVAGGVRDPNVLSLLSAGRNRGVKMIPLLIGEGECPSLRWDPGSDDLWLNGDRVLATGAFLRRDVFHGGGHEAGYRAATWHATLAGWLAASVRIRTPNRPCLDRYTNKLHALRMAAESGLAIPATVATNHLDWVESNLPVEDSIAKPVPGGGYCSALTDLMERTERRNGTAAAPAIVQRRLPGADLRVYRVNGRCIGFIIESDAIDYRTTRNRTIARTESVPEGVEAGLESLMLRMGLDWGAADFKLDPETGDATFLEINSNPMFSAFDRVAGGVIAEGLLEYLWENGK